jgi:hypothetical protein
MSTLPEKLNIFYFLCITFTALNRYPFASVSHLCQQWHFFSVTALYVLAAYKPLTLVRGHGVHTHHSNCHLREETWWLSGWTLNHVSCTLCHGLISDVSHSTCLLLKQMWPPISTVCAHMERLTSVCTCICTFLFQESKTKKYCRQESTWLHHHCCLHHGRPTGPVLIT